MAQLLLNMVKSSIADSTLHLMYSHFSLTAPLFPSSVFWESVGWRNSGLSLAQWVEVRFAPKCFTFRHAVVFAKLSGTVLYNLVSDKT